MKKYLNKYTVILFLTQIIFSVKAEQSSNFYESLFSELKIPHENIIDLDFTKKIENKNLLVETNQLKLKNIKEGYFKNFHYIFFFCNSNYELENYFKCSKDGFEFLSKNAETKTIELYNSELKQNFNIGYIKIEDTKIFIFQENNLFEKSNQSILKKFIDSLKEIKQQSNQIPNNNQDISSILIKLYNNLNRTFTFELFVYSLVITTAYSFIINLLIYFRKNYKKICLNDTINEISNSLFGFFKRNIYLKIFLLFIIFFALSNILVISNYININSIIKLNSELVSFDYKRILLLNLLLLVILTLTISRIDVCYFFLKDLFLKISNTKTQQSKIPTLIILSLFFLIIGILIEKNLQSKEILIIGVFLSILTILTSFYEKKDPFISINKKYKFLISAGSLVLCLILAASLYYKIDKIYTYEDLVSSKDLLVILPYAKELNSSKLIKSTTISSSSPIFVDNFLVFHPDVESIDNVSENNFSKIMNEKFYVTSKNLPNLLMFISKNNYIDEFSTKQSNIYFAKLLNKTVTSAYINIDVFCNQVKNENLTINFYRPTSKVAYEKKEQPLGSFINCSKDIQNYRFGIPHQYIEQRNFFIEIKSLEKNQYNNLNISYNNSRELAELSAINIQNQGDIYFLESISNPVNKNKVINLILDQEQGTYLSSSKDISGNINYLVRNRLLKDNFLIWSTDSLAIIKNNYVKK